MLIFVSEKNRPLLLAKGVYSTGKHWVNNACVSAPAYRERERRVDGGWYVHSFKNLWSNIFDCTPLVISTMLRTSLSMPEKGNIFISKQKHSFSQGAFFCEHDDLSEHFEVVCTVETLYSTIYYSNFFFFRAQFWQVYTICCPLNSQKTPHTSPFRASYGVSFVSISTEIDRVIKGFYCTQKDGLRWVTFSPENMGQLISYYLISAKLDHIYHEKQQNNSKKDNGSKQLEWDDASRGNAG